MGNEVAIPSCSSFSSYIKWDDTKLCSCDTFFFCLVGCPLHISIYSWKPAIIELMMKCIFFIYLIKDKNVCKSDNNRTKGIRCYPAQSSQSLALLVDQSSQKSDVICSFFYFLSCKLVTVFSFYFHIFTVGPRSLQILFKKKA